MKGLHIWLLLYTLALVLGTVRPAYDVPRGHGRSLQQGAPCTTSTVAGNWSGSGVLASDPLCLQVGEFSVPCPSIQPCACPTLGPVDALHNLLGCYDPSAYYCSTDNPQWSSVNYGTALSPGTGVSNLGVCWNNTAQTLSDFGTANNAHLPSAAALAAAIEAANATAASPAASPAATPAPGFANDIKDAANSNTGTIVGIVFSIVGPVIAVTLWLSITWSHREEKHMVLSGVVRHIAVSDISSNYSTLISSSHEAHCQPQHFNPFGVFALKLPFNRLPSPQPDTFRSRELSSIPCHPMPQAGPALSPSLDQANPSSGWGPAASEVPSRNLLQTSQLSPSELSPRWVDSAQTDYPLVDVRTVARHITTRCLRRWDGFLAVRAGKDSLDRRKGVWKDKFESVRSAAMLLAFRKVNATLQKQVLRAPPDTPEPPGSLRAAWQTGNSDEKDHLITFITKTLQDISEEEAQALQIKDPEAAGWHDKLSSILDRCTCCTLFRQQRATFAASQSSGTGHSDLPYQV